MEAESAQDPTRSGEPGADELHPTPDLAAAEPAAAGWDAVELEACDGYVVFIADPQTGARDTYGPFPYQAAIDEAERHTRELRAEDLTDIEVAVLRHHQRPRPL